jgi:CelD/BcsL family acetyltransferase involved in cellulose biosynthesis
MYMGLVSRTTSLGSIDAQLRDCWVDLTVAAGVDLSMAPQWFESTVRSRGAVERARVFTVYDADRLVGLVPYIVATERSAGLAARSRESPGNFLVAYHPEVISVIDTEALLQMYLEDAARGCDMVVLPNLEKGERTAAAALVVADKLRVTCIERTGHTSPFLSISGDWDCFLSTKNKKFRYKVRTGLKNLEEAGAVTNRWFSTSAEVGDLLAEILRVEDNSWKVEARMAVSTSQMEHEYYRLLLPFIATRQALHANVLYLDCAPIAYSLCYISDGCVRQLKTSFDQRYARLSPGAVCHQLAIRKAFEIGAREFDFLGDVMLHKSLWASGAREHVSLYLFLPTWRGTLLGSGRRFKGWIKSRLESRRATVTHTQGSGADDGRDAGKEDS